MTPHETLESKLEEIESRLNAATPGPWEAKKAIFGIRYICRNGEVIGDIESGRDLEFIAHSPTDITYLLEIAKAYKKAVEVIEFYADKSSLWVDYGHDGSVNAVEDSEDSWCNERGQRARDFLKKFDSACEVEG